MTSKSNSSPKLIVFDLDWTLWNFGTQLLGGPPFHQDAKTGDVTDKNGVYLSVYPESFEVMERLRKDHPEVLVCLASRTTTPEWAAELTTLFKMPGTGQSLDSLSTEKQIYPGSKVQHFAKFHADTGVAYEEMLFFDDEMRNIEDVGGLGVVCVYVPLGLSMHAYERGMAMYAERHSSGV